MSSHKLSFLTDNALENILQGVLLFIPLLQQGLCPRLDLPLNQLEPLIRQIIAAVLF